MSQDPSILNLQKATLLMLIAAIKGEKVKAEYKLKQPAGPTASDLVQVEKSVNGLVAYVIRILYGEKIKKKDYPKLHLDLGRLKWVDDGDSTVTVTLDFSAILPIERTPQMLITAAELEAQLERLKLAGEGEAP